MASSTSEHLDWSSFQRFLAGSGDDLNANQVAGEPAAQRTAAPYFLVQANRRANLIVVLKELAGRELGTLIEKARLLGVPRSVLHEAIAGRGLGDDEAREIEWAMNRPIGWLDQDHQGSPD